MSSVWWMNIICCLLVFRANSHQQQQQRLKHFGVTIPSSALSSQKQWKYKANAYIDQGVNTFRLRLPFYDEAIIDDAGKFNEIWQPIDNLLNVIARDLHSYAILELFADEASQHDSIVHNLDKFVSFWAQIASNYKYNNRVIYSLLYKPCFRSTETWINFANAAIRTIRDIGSVNLILVQGNRKSDLVKWNETDEFGLSNAEAMLKIQDPFDRIAFEINVEYSSYYETAALDDAKALSEFEYLKIVSEWLENNQRIAFLSQLANPDSDTQLAVALRHMERRRMLWLGWSWEEITGSGNDVKLIDAIDNVLTRAEELDDFLAAQESSEEKSTKTESPSDLTLKVQETTACHYACPEVDGAKKLSSRLMSSIGGIGLLTTIFILIGIFLHP